MMVGLTAQSRNLVFLPTFHTGGLNVYANPTFHTGGCNVVMRSFEPRAVPAAAERQARSGSPMRWACRPTS